MEQEYVLCLEKLHSNLTSVWRPLFSQALAPNNGVGGGIREAAALPLVRRVRQLPLSGTTA